MKLDTFGVLEGTQAKQIDMNRYSSCLPGGFEPIYMAIGTNPGTIGEIISPKFAQKWRVVFFARNVGLKYKQPVLKERRSFGHSWQI